MKDTLVHDKQFWKFSLYGFLKNLRFFDPYLLLFFHSVGESYTQIGLLFSIREIGTNLLEIPSGIFADSFGRRKSMIICFTGYILSFIILFFSKNFFMFALAMVLFSVGEAFRTGTHKAMILEYLRIHEMLHLKAEYYGQTRGWSQTGSAVSSLIAAAIVFFSGNYRSVFLWTLIPYIGGLFLMISYPKELDFTAGHTDSGLSLREQMGRSLKALLSIFIGKKLRTCVLNCSLYESLFKTSKDYLQQIVYQFSVALPILVFLTDHERSSLVIGIVYFFLFLLTSVSSRNAGKFSARNRGLPRSMNLLYLTGAIFMIAAGVLFRMELNGVVIIIFVLFYMVQNIRKPLTVAYLSENIDHSVMATGLSGESQVQTLITAIAAPIFGFLVDSRGIGTAFMIFGAAAIILLGVLKISDDSGEPHEAR